jgi:hypothetical protein
VAMHGGHHGQMAPMGAGGYAPQGMMYRAFSPFLPFAPRNADSPSLVTQLNNRCSLDTLFKVVTTPDTDDR